ncbi:MAG: hypothetical protein AAGC77_07410 [Pseudomonadota bacterium]
MHVKLRETPAKTTERRLTKRVEALWRMALAKDCPQNRLPSWPQLQAMDFGADARFCFAVDMRLSDGFPYFIYLGEELCRYSNLYLAGRDQFEDTLLDVAAGKLNDAVRAGDVFEYDDAFVLFDGRDVVFRSIFLPLSEDGHAITHIFGAANGRLC